MGLISLLIKRASKLKVFLKWTLPVLLVLPLLIYTRVNFDVFANSLCEKPTTPSLGETLEKEQNQSTDLLQRTTNEIKKIQSEESTNEDRLSQLVKERKQYLVEALYTNPKSVLDSILPQDTLEKMQTIAPGCVEKEILIEGTVEIFHSDFFDENKSETFYLLSTNQGDKINLHPAYEFHSALLSGQKIKIKGIAIDNEILFDARQPVTENGFQGGYEILVQPENAQILGEQKVLVILANFNNTTQPSLSQKSVSDFFSSKPAPYYLENSYSKISLNADVIG